MKEVECSERMKECEQMLCYASLNKADEFIVYRVIWLRASARFNRWDEEVALLQHEMQWTASFFKHKQDQWEQMATEVGNARSGLGCYACKQAAVWAKFKAHARNTFGFSK